MGYISCGVIFSKKGQKIFSPFEIQPKWPQVKLIISLRLGLPGLKFSEQLVNTLGLLKSIKLRCAKVCDFLRGPSKSDKLLKMASFQNSFCHFFEKKNFKFFLIANEF